MWKGGATIDVQHRLLFVGSLEGYSTFVVPVPADWVIDHQTGLMQLRMAVLPPMTQVGLVASKAAP